MQEHFRMPTVGDCVEDVLKIDIVFAAIIIIGLYSLWIGVALLAIHFVFNYFRARRVTAEAEDLERRRAQAAANEAERQAVYDKHWEDYRKENYGRIFD